MLAFCSCNYLDYDETSGFSKDEMFVYFSRTKKMLTNVYGYLPKDFGNVGNAMLSATMPTMPGRRRRSISSATAVGAPSIRSTISGRSSTRVSVLQISFSKVINPTSPTVSGMTSTRMRCRPMSIILTRPGSCVHFSISNWPNVTTMFLCLRVPTLRRRSIRSSRRVLTRLSPLSCRNAMRLLRNCL